MYQYTLQHFDKYSRIHIFALKNTHKITKTHYNTQIIQISDEYNLLGKILINSINNNDPC